jgi:hypothetical protein
MTTKNKIKNKKLSKNEYFIKLLRQIYFLMEKLEIEDFEASNFMYFLLQIEKNDIFVFKKRVFKVCKNDLLTYYLTDKTLKKETHKWYGFTIEVLQKIVEMNFTVQLMRDLFEKLPEYLETGLLFIEESDSKLLLLEKNIYIGSFGSYTYKLLDLKIPFDLP